MRDCYIVVIVLLFGYTSYAQISERYQPAPKDIYIENAVKPLENQSIEKAVLWANDFSSPSDWIMWDNSVPPTSWQLTSDVNALPQFDFPSMTTAVNGYALINSDAMEEAATQDCFLEYSGTINCTGIPNVSIQFEQKYQNYQETRSVQISNDGGVIWHDFFITEPSSLHSSDDGIYTINISQVASNQSAVSIRFHYMASDGWYWAVDDVRFIETEPYDLEAVSSNWGSIGPYGKLMSYYSVPLDLVQPIQFCGITSNIGVNDVSDATYSVDITGAENVSLSGQMEVLSNELDTICATTNFTPSLIGNYSFEHQVATTNTETGGIQNNVFESFNVNVEAVAGLIQAKTYARDNLHAGIQGGIYNKGNEYEAGNVFDITSNNLAIDFGTFVVHQNTTPLSLAQIILYSIDPNNGSLTFIDFSDYYEITSWDIGNEVSLPLLNGTDFLSEGSYLLTVKGYGFSGTTEDVVVGTSGYSTPETSLYYDGTIGEWFYSTHTPMVRMEVYQYGVGVNKVQDPQKMSVYPNPAVNEATVSFALNNASDVMVNVTDLSGKVVYTTSIGNAAAGTNSVAVNTSSLSNGIYMVNVSTNEVVTTQKLVIKK